MGAEAIAHIQHQYSPHNRITTFHYKCALCALSISCLCPVLVLSMSCPCPVYVLFADGKSVLQFEEMLQVPAISFRMQVAAEVGSAPIFKSSLQVLNCAHQP